MIDRLCPPGGTKVAAPPQIGTARARNDPAPYAAERAGSGSLRGQGVQDDFPVLSKNGAMELERAMWTFGTGD